MIGYDLSGKVACFLTALSLIACAHRVAVYVSPVGRDSNDGSLGAPFATLARAQLAMQASSTIKTTYLRAGTYANPSLTLTSADSGETWSQYIPDGYGTAVLDGGASSATSGGVPINIEGGSNITINGLRIQNFQSWGVGIHGGDGNNTPGVFPTGYGVSTPNVTGTTVSNNFFYNGYYNYSLAGAAPLGAIFQLGQVTNSTFENNVISNMQGAGILAVPYLCSCAPGAKMDGLTIKNNAIFYTSTFFGDSGAIYMVDRESESKNITISNNFIRDYQGTNGYGDPLDRDVAIYLDEASEYVTVTGNVIANTANVVEGNAALQGTMAFFCSSCRYTTFSGNIIDLGTTGRIVDAAMQVYLTSYPAMTGNTVAGNIYLGNWSGVQNSWGIGQGSFAYPSGGPAAPTVPTLRNNLYFNYGGGQMSTSGNAFSDTAPVTGVDPQISGTTYSIAAGSPVLDAPLNFPPIVGGWGPPGYTIPATGTAPSYSGKRTTQRVKKYTGL